MTNSGIPLAQWSGSDATDQLRKVVEAANVATELNTRTIVRLTWALTVMTGVLVIGLVAQIWLAIR